MKNIAKTFTQNSETFTLDENAKELTLAQLRDKECAGEKKITIIDNDCFFLFRTKFGLLHLFGYISNL